MRESDTFPGTDTSVWVLASPGAGDNAQLRTVAGLFGGRARWFDRVDSLGRVVLDRLSGAAFETKRFEPPWPDLVLFAGGRQVSNARRIRTASGGRSRIVCIGRPWAPLAWFDLIVTTPQYRLPDATNVLVLDLPLNRAPVPTDEAREHWLPGLAELPSPLLGVLLGGDSGSYRIRPRDIDRLARRIDAVASPSGAGVALVDSPRSPPGLAGRIGCRLEAPVAVCAAEAGEPNPYAVVIDRSDALLVTEDSVSMIADAVNSRKPVATLRLTQRWHARVSRAVRRGAPRLTRFGAGLARRGLWFPPRDVRALCGRLIERGLLQQPDAVLASRSGRDGRRDPFAENRSRLLERLASLARESR